MLNLGNLHTDQRGMTLIELVVVVAIIAILSAISFPFFSRFGEPTNFRSAARQVMLLAMRARSEAVRAGQIRWRLATTPPSTIELQEETAAASGVYVTKYSFSLKEFGYGIKMIDSTVHVCGNATDNWNGDPINLAGTISFNGRGFGNAGSIYLVNNKADVCYALGVATNGLARLHYYNGTAPFAAANWD